MFFAKINKPPLPNKPPPLKVILTNKPPGAYSIIYGSTKIRVIPSLFYVQTPDSSKDTTENFLDIFD